MLAGILGTVGVVGTAYAGVGEMARNWLLSGIERPAPYRLEPRYRISLIIPAYNEEKYLGRLLDTVYNQTEPLYEVIVCDGESTDSTAMIAEQYGAKVVPVPYGNISIAKNMGAAAAEGDIFLFADADMVLHNAFVEVSADYMPYYPLVHAKYLLYDSAKWNLVTWPGLLTRSSDFPCACLMVTRDAFEHVRGYDEECNSMTGEFCLEAKDFALRVKAAFGDIKMVGGMALIGASARRYEAQAPFKVFGIDVRGNKDRDLNIPIR